jgi:YaaC-like Protein
MTVRKALLELRELKIHKAVHHAQFERKNVLTNDPSIYVDLWLRSNGFTDSLFYWRQALEFYEASKGLSTNTSPVVLYYAFLNAVKALLSAKQVAFTDRHGVSGKKLSPSGSAVSLSGEGIKFHRHGIVPSLSAYFAETEQNLTHSLEDVLYNLVFVHRTFNLTNLTRAELFTPLKVCEYVHDDASGEVYLRAKTVSDVNWSTFRANLPTSFSLLMFDGSEGVRSVSSVQWVSSQNPSSNEIDKLRLLNQELRYYVQYIHGSQSLWYMKMNGASRLQRQSLTLTLAAMHRLSEMCRYKPSDLQALMNGSENWLVSEFIMMSPIQFFDEIACEITGDQVLIPNVRSPR